MLPCTLSFDLPTFPYLPSSKPLYSHTRVRVHLAKMTTAAFPRGGTYFSNHKSFANVYYDAANDNAIDTTQLLEAAESLTTLFDVLGSAAFKPVQSDMRGNIKVRPRWL